MRARRLPPPLLLCVASTAVACGTDSTRPRTEILLEVGGPPPDAELVVDRLRDALIDDGAQVTVRVLDGPNATFAERVRPPGVSSDGELDTEAVNRTVRNDVLAGLRDDHLVWVESLFDVDDTPEGRDIIGALGNISRQEPDRVVVFFSNGGLHRTVDDDWSITDQWAVDVDLAPDTVLEFHGVGSIEASNGGVAAKAITDALTDVWLDFCDLYESCEVVS